jgi:chromosome segregation ATPase
MPNNPRNDIPITTVSTLKELWERMTSLETNVYNIQKCNDTIKSKLDRIQQESVTLDAYKESSAIRHNLIESSIRDLRIDIEKIEQTKAELTEVKEATRLAKENVDTRLNTMNEFRGQLKDQANTFIPRLEYQVQHESLEQRIEEQRKSISNRIDAQDKEIKTLTSAKDRLDGKASQNSVFIAYGIGIIGLIIAVVSIFLH